jgi:hypothetical protein
LILFIILIALTLLSYFIFIPIYIQYRIDSLDVSHLQLDYLNLKAITTHSVEFTLKASLPPLFFLPIQAALGQSTWSLVDDQNHLMCELLLPRLQFQLNQDLSLDFSGSVDFTHANTSALSALVQQFSSHQGLSSFTLDAQSRVALSAIGIQWYSALYLHRSIQAQAPVHSDLTSLSNMIPSFVLADPSRIFISFFFIFL